MNAVPMYGGKIEYLNHFRVSQLPSRRTCPMHFSK